MDESTIKVYDERAEEYATMVTRETIDPSLQLFMDTVPAGSPVLDLGCGNGGSSAVLAEYGFGVTAVDASKEMVKICNTFEGVNAIQASFDEVIGGVLADSERFVGIWANFSLLHVSREACRAVIQGLLPLCANPAWLHLGMKIGQGERRDRLGRYYVYYSEEELIDIMVDAGFMLQHCLDGEGAGLAGDIEPWVTLLGMRE